MILRGSSSAVAVLHAAIADNRFATSGLHADSTVAVIRRFCGPEISDAGLIIYLTAFEGFCYQYPYR